MATPAPTHMERRDPLRAVIGFEPQSNDEVKRALTDAISHIPRAAKTITQAKRELPTIRTVTATITGSQTFYSCSNGWVLTRGMAGTGTSAGGGLVPSASGGSGEYRCALLTFRLTVRLSPGEAT